MNYILKIINSLWQLRKKEGKETTHYKTRLNVRSQKLSVDFRLDMDHHKGKDANKLT